MTKISTAPKSNRTYEAWKAALGRARETPGEPVPLHIRNAPTPLMKSLGYGKGYKYDHAEESGVAEGQRYLPDAIGDSDWYEPGSKGYEKTIRERLQWFSKRRGLPISESE